MTHVDLAVAAASIRNRLNYHAVGYAFALGTPSSDPIMYWAGNAKTAADAPSVPVSSQTKFQSASVTKFVTAVAVMKLLGQRGKTLDDEIGPLLPTGWTVDQDVFSIRFGEIMCYTSGVPDAGLGTYADLETYFTQTLALSPKVPQRYQDLTWQLLRVVLPKLNDSPDPTASDDPAAYYASQYVDIVNACVFAPVGVPTVTTTLASGQQEALAYAYPGDSPGYDWTNQPASSTQPQMPIGLYSTGAGGLFTSIEDFIPVLQSWADPHDERILKRAQWEQMYAWNTGLPDANGMPWAYPLCFGAWGTGAGTVGSDKINVGMPECGGYLWLEKNGGAGVAGTTTQSSIGLFGGPTTDPLLTTPVNGGGTPIINGAGVSNGPVYGVLFINSNITPLGIGGWMWCENCAALWYTADPKGVALREEISSLARIVR